ncbi:MAG TPA: ABC transporter ATP-binding protein [Candidatus Nanoarchaeia archaeon]|nr:ABC transporter ATP-binding protein [Candidatus Nanoarchaeia archaeon]
MQRTPEPALEFLIETSKLTKCFGVFTALSDLNLRVMPGEIYGLLGPNGAGKTTTIKTVLGLLEPTSGWIKVAGFDPVKNPLEVKAKIGYVAENPMVYDSLSPRDFLEFVASIRKIDKASSNELVCRLADAFEMAQYFDSPIATLSLGMKQKVALIASLIHRPKVLLLDEPLNGLDAKSSRIVKDLISFHAEKGGAVLFSTHIMEVAQQICTKIGIIYQGKLISEGTLDQLRNETHGEGNTLEEVFLKLTHEESEVADTSKILREAFFRNENT